MNNFLLKTIQCAVTILLTFQLSACGTMLHSERKGQKGGRLDPAIVLLNGIGLLAFVLPGIIAFAVDFSNGTIYLPHSASKASESEFRIVKLDSSQITYDQIEEVIRREMNVDIDLHLTQVDVIRMKSLDELSGISNQRKTQQLVFSVL